MAAELPETNVDWREVIPIGDGVSVRSDDPDPNPYTIVVPKFISMFEKGFGPCVGHEILSDDKSKTTWIFYRFDQEVVRLRLDDFEKHQKARKQRIDTLGGKRITESPVEMPSGLDFSAHAALQEMRKGEFKFINVPITQDIKRVNPLPLDNYMKERAARGEFKPLFFTTAGERISHGDITDDMKRHMHLYIFLQPRSPVYVLNGNLATVKELMELEEKEQKIEEKLKEEEEKRKKKKEQREESKKTKRQDQGTGSTSIASKTSGAVDPAHKQSTLQSVESDSAASQLPSIKDSVGTSPDDGQEASERKRADSKISDQIREPRPLEAELTHGAENIATEGSKSTAESREYHTSPAHGEDVNPTVLERDDQPSIEKPETPGLQQSVAQAGSRGPTDFSTAAGVGQSTEAQPVTSTAPTTTPIQGSGGEGVAPKSEKGKEEVNPFDVLLESLKHQPQSDAEGLWKRPSYRGTQLSDSQPDVSFNPVTMTQVIQAFKAAFSEVLAKVDVLTTKIDVLTTNGAEVKKEIRDLKAMIDGQNRVMGHEYEMALAANPGAVISTINLYLNQNLEKPIPPASRCFADVDGKTLESSLSLSYKALVQHISSDLNASSSRVEFNLLTYTESRCLYIIEATTRELLKDVKLETVFGVDPNSLQTPASICTPIIYKLLQLERQVATSKAKPRGEYEVVTQSCGLPSSTVAILHFRLHTSEQAPAVSLSPYLRNQKYPLNTALMNLASCAGVFLAGY